MHKNYKRFKKESALRPQVPDGRSSELLRNNIETENFFEQISKNAQGIQQESSALSYGAIGKILRENIKWRAYWPHFMQCLSSARIKILSLHFLVDL